MNNIPSMGVLAGNRKLSVLKYADDLVLCSVTSDGLQLGMNALHEFCLSNNQGWGQVQLTKYSSTPSTPNIYQVQVLVKYSFF